MPPNAGWPLRSRLRRAVGRSDGWSVLRWGEFRTGSVQDALGGPGPPEEGSGLIRPIRVDLMWKTGMPSAMAINANHSLDQSNASIYLDTLTGLWRVCVLNIHVQACVSEMSKRKTETKEENVHEEERYFLQDVCELFRMISSYKFWPLKMIRKKYESLKRYSFKGLWHSLKINHGSRRSS